MRELRQGDAGSGFLLFADKYTKDINSVLVMTEWDHDSKRHITDEVLSKRNEQIYDLIQKRNTMMRLYQQTVDAEEEFLYGDDE